jgi:hypothetical protein
MEEGLLTASEIDRLAAEVDLQLSESAAAPPLVSKAGKVDLRTREAQRRVIEEATGQPVESFWEKYKSAARKDLCEPDGLLYKQWHRWRDLQSKDAVKVSYGILAGLGISGAALPAATVAATVLLLNVVLNIGVNAICEDFAGKRNEP